MQITMDLFSDEMIIASTDTKGLRPEQMTLSQFLSDSSWRAELDLKATGESKGMFNMIEPNGGKYRGGWIGKFRNEDLAKRDFHKNAVYYSIHRGGFLSEHVLSDYPKLLMAQRGIQKKIDNIHLLSGTHFRVRVENVDRYAHLLDVPLYSRVCMREFVWNHRFLIDGTSRFGNNPIDEVEQMAIALEMKIKVIPKDHRPHFLFGKHESVLRNGSSDTRVRFVIPQEFDEAGFLLRYEIHEGVCTYNSGSLMPAVRYVVDDVENRMILYPSHIIAISQHNEDWITLQGLNEL